MSIELIEQCGARVMIIDNSFDRCGEVQRSSRDLAELRDE
jgi:hypothetical protein